jgi:predicted O-methyltransferase YrrM
MKNVGKRFARLLLSIGERVLTPLSTKWLKLVKNRRYSETVFMKEGLLPIVNHYYEPMINPKRDLKKSLREDRNLLGVNFNEIEQLQLLSLFNYNDELLAYPVEQQDKHSFFYNNGWYETGDAEFLYSIVRHFKPKKIIEVGCGSSTLMIQNAVAFNKTEDENYRCEHICIEPFEQPWLEKLGLQIIREKVENISLQFFKQLGENDILFIDSSHIIRPQGDVLFEYLELLPSLNSGVLIHIHDIFTPKDYPDEWIHKHLFWNEQYLVEAFLTFNSNFRIIGALNYLAHNHPKEFSEKCPVFQQNRKEPKAFWLVKQ